MTNRRLPHTPATSHRTGGDDRPAGACYGLAERMAPDPTPFDVLTDHSAGPAFEAARREARDLCGVRADGKFRAPEDRCPLAAVCLMRDNAEEPWARAVLGVKLAPTERSVCGKRLGVVAHSKAGETNCDACREFMRNQWKDRKRPERAITHGTDTGYSRHRKAGEEACRPCLDAHREAERKMAARKREAAA